MRQRNPDAQCENCPYWERDHAENWVGENDEPIRPHEKRGDPITARCLRFPPRLLVHNMTDQFITGRGQVCGEHPDFFLPDTESDDPSPDDSIRQFLEKEADRYQSMTPAERILFNASRRQYDEQKDKAPEPPSECVVCRGGDMSAEMLVNGGFEMCAKHYIECFQKDKNMTKAHIKIFALLLVSSILAGAILYLLPIPQEVKILMGFVSGAIVGGVLIVRYY